MDMISAKDYDVTPLFTAAAAAAAADDDKSVALLAASLTAAMGKQQPEAAALKLRADRQETEDFYLTVSPQLNAICRAEWRYIPSGWNFDSNLAGVWACETEPSIG